MSQERWDVVMRFTAGPLSFQGDVVCRGPVVRLGANPGPGGLKLDGYRGLDNRQAVITAYDGGTVSIAPVGANQVRVAPHEHVAWAEVQPIRGPVYLDPGSAFHLGPPERGVTAVFIEARRLGVWEQRQILSDSSQASPTVRPSNVKELDTRRGRPVWFIPAMLVTAMATAVGVVFSLLPFFFRKVPPLGPVVEGEAVYKIVAATEVVDPALQEGLNQPFHDFVVKPSADQARWPELARNPENWDREFLEYVKRSVTVHAKAWKFWQRLDVVRDDYRYVVLEMRAAKLPEVFAAIPYLESTYNAEARSPVCAYGYWQMMPEYAHRFGLEVRDCKMRGTAVLWNPTRLIPVLGVLRNAPYVDPQGPSCKIERCAGDERDDLQASTRAAIEALTEAYNDPVLADSGAAVQLAILSHNCGYDDSRFEEKKERKMNVLPAYQRYLDATKQDRAPDFYGQNVTCLNPEDLGIENTNKTCGGALASQSQHYAYNIVAEHILAVCFYAQNYSNLEPFNRWREYLRGEGYCARLKIPTQEELAKRGGK